MASDTWEWDGNTWTRAVTASTPGPRFGMDLAYDRRRQVVVLFGGYSRISRLADTWEYDGNDWTQRQPAVSPPARYHHALTWEELRDRVVMFGGFERSAGHFADLWEYQTPSPAAPACRSSSHPRASCRGSARSPRSSSATSRHRARRAS